MKQFLTVTSVTMYDTSTECNSISNFTIRKKISELGIFNSSKRYLSLRLSSFLRFINK